MPQNKIHNMVSKCEVQNKNGEHAFISEFSNKLETKNMIQTNLQFLPKKLNAELLCGKHQKIRTSSKDQSWAVLG